MHSTPPRPSAGPALQEEEEEACALNSSLAVGRVKPWARNGYEWTRASIF